MVVLIYQNMLWCTPLSLQPKSHPYFCSWAPCIILACVCKYFIIILNYSNYDKEHCKQTYDEEYILKHPIGLFQKNLHHLFTITN